MKFRYYIQDPYDGCIRGTNSENKAREIAACEDFFVVDAQEGLWLMSDGTFREVQDVEGEQE